MDVTDVIHKRRSIRSYTDEVVSREIIEKLIVAGQAAPTSCNLQLTEYIIVTDPLLKATLSKEVTGKFNWAPTYIIFVYDPRFTIARSASITSLGASMQNIILTATDLGLVACPMAGFERDNNLKRILQIPSHYNVGLIMSIGYDKGIEKKGNVTKTALSEILHYNRYESPRHILNDSQDLSDWSFAEIHAYRSRLAPVYLYPGRFNLSTYAPLQYEEMYRIFSEHVNTRDKDLIDVLSYDCCFAKTAIEKGDMHSLAVSDIINHPLTTFVEEYPHAKSHRFTSFNALDAADGSYDIATFVHKAEFTPELDAVFAEVHRVLKSGGVLFVTMSSPSFALRLANWVRAINMKLRGNTINVYEHNKAYKIGPFKYLSSHTIDSLSSESGFAKRTSGERKMGNKFFSTNIYWALYEKI